MGWDNDLTTDPAGFSQQQGGSITSTFATGWVFWIKQDTAIFKLYSFADDLEITIQLFADEQSNTVPFDAVTFDMSANSPATFWRYTGFPARGDGTPQTKFRVSFTCTKQTNNARTCANYAILIADSDSAG
jgi:hypothetical protein